MHGKAGVLRATEGTSGLQTPSPAETHTGDPGRLLLGAAALHTDSAPAACVHSPELTHMPSCAHLGCPELVRQYRYPVDCAAPGKQLLQLLRRRAKVNIVDEDRARVCLLFAACLCSCVVLHALCCCAAAALHDAKTQSADSAGVEVLPA
jgi:hypothetical protein